jgi:hypothetical protein
MPEATETVAPLIMPVSNTSVPVPNTSTVSAPSAITLSQFGVELSRADKRVELVNAFIFSQKQAGFVKDTKANYQARFAAFVNHPA